MAKAPEFIPDEPAENQISDNKTAQKSIYPEVNDRLKSLALWFAVAFIVFAVVIQKYSGFF